MTEGHLYISQAGIEFTMEKHEGEGNSLRAGEWCYDRADFNLTMWLVIVAFAAIVTVALVETFWTATDVAAVDLFSVVHVFTCALIYILLFRGTRRVGLSIAITVALSFGFDIGEWLLDIAAQYGWLSQLAWIVGESNENRVTDLLFNVIGTAIGYVAVAVQKKKCPPGYLQPVRG